MRHARPGARASAVLICALALGACARQEVRNVAATPPRPTTASPTATPLATPPLPRTTLQVAGRTIDAEVAETPAARQIGLMFRRSLPKDSGMLFVFQAPSAGGFWMKNTLIPLAIAYMRAEEGGYRIVAIREMVPCTADPCPTYAPGEAYDAALEMNEGWFADAGVEVGDVIERESGSPRPT